MENSNLIAIKAWISAVVATLTAFWGWFGWLLVAWVFLMLSDWLVGSAAAAHRGFGGATSRHRRNNGIIKFYKT